MKETALMIKKYRLEFYLPLLIIVALASVILRTVASFGSYDFKYGYYYSSTLFSVSVWLVVICVAILFTFASPRSKTVKEPNIPFGTKEVFFPSAIAMLGLLFSSFSFFKFALDSGATSNVKPFLNVPANTVALVGGVLGLLSIVYFILSSVCPDDRSIPRASFGMVTVLYLVIYSAYLYFDTELAINAHSKIVDQCAYVFAAIFFLYETRVSLGRQSWRLYGAFGLVASLLCAYSSIPSVIVYLATGKVVSHSIYESVLTLALFAFIFARVWLVAFSRDNGTPSTANAICSNSLIKKESVREHEAKMMEIIERQEQEKNSDFNEKAEDTVSVEQIALSETEDAESVETAQSEGFDAAKPSDEADAEPDGEQSVESNEESLEVSDATESVAEDTQDESANEEAITEAVAETDSQETTTEVKDGDQ